MLRPSQPLRRSIDGWRRESNSSQSSKVSMTSRRLSCRSHEASALFSTASAARCANTAPPGPAALPDAEVTSAVSLPSLRSCTAEAYKVSDLRSVHRPQQLTPPFLATAADFVDSGAAAVTDKVESYADGRTKEPSSPRKISTPHHACLQVFFDGTNRQPCMPKSAQRLFTSAEVSTLRSEAQQTYTRRKRTEEQKELIAAEAEARSLLAEAALDQIAAVRELQEEERESRMRAVSAAALPVQYLEQRIRRRIDEEYAQQDAQLRQEGRDAWRLRVELETAASVDASTREVERRAATHRFRAALTFIIVQEMELRKLVEAESAKFWETFVQEEAEGKADAENRALVRFLNTPEQLALAAAREKRERRRALRTAKLLRLFQEQQEGFVKGCRHGTGGVSLFVGDAPKKVCGRCRVKWDEGLGYYVSIDRTVKIHPPPPPITAAAEADVKTASHAAKRASAEAAKSGCLLPPLKKMLK
ncbi:hypothetical protein conserved [Leishmania donovani]|uniref:Uncharacterized protein n=3 Tax=Leishmania donovani species complex TaxID=38574 RepID=A4I2A8_LEIIN|nr:conserved hypothetical protein [Leishmania infantum JPCM5]XP_003861760.1 hypothetical protein, conserved [Leishmania donovani]CAC9497127.1 hypothetical_protein_-_conserved [Leishmania infantum]TPP41205.1 hypothetical protein CGC21_32180 [Leishmania donovani]TPP52049.1 hypothetical protein CGC20_5330 [Leishmania donovani]CAJ1989763.1 hypothetical protein conserved [Leishmania donovani]CAM68897.1 conserved hypothetical protein [Leishmania infantum JPCM5]|eukprot:XP_001470519.1 conserved hypothetical protein [Leishmania infantum JPCM5]